MMEEHRYMKRFLGRKVFLARKKIENAQQEIALFRNESAMEQTSKTTNAYDTEQAYAKSRSA